MYISLFFFFFFQAEDGIRDLVRSRGLGDVYKRQAEDGETDRPDAGAIDQNVEPQCHDQPIENLIRLAVEQVRC